MKRYYAENINAEKTLLDGELFRHIALVMRQKVGDEFVLFNNAQKAQVKITNMDKRSLEVEKIADLQLDISSPCKIHLAQVILTGEKMDFCMQKATELGVNAITPLLAENFSKKLDSKRQAKKLEHWQKIIINACEQSGNDSIPQLNPVVRLSDFVQHAEFEHKIFLDFNGANWQNFVEQHNKIKNIGLVVGSAGGLSQAEVTMLKNNNWQGINLGKRILRGETASLAILTLLQNQWGDLKL